MPQIKDVIGEIKKYKEKLEEKINSEQVNPKQIYDSIKYQPKVKNFTKYNLRK